MSRDGPGWKYVCGGTVYVRGKMDSMVTYWRHREKTWNWIQLSLKPGMSCSMVASAYAFLACRKG
jgi:hypothetical protein